MSDRREGSGPAEQGFATRIIHLGRRAGEGDRALVPPIVQSATFEIEDVRAGAEIMRGERRGNVYTRMGNPTISGLEDVLADLEQGAGALVTSSGMAASATVLFALAESGARVVAGRAVYGGTRQLLVHEGTRFGIKVRFVDPNDAAALDDALAGAPRLVWIESPANPNLDLTDIAEVAAAARRAGALTVVDNTFATPFLQRPLSLGADIVVHSLTKALNGHSDVVAGVVIAKTSELLEKLRATRTHLGGVADPHQAWLVLRGLRTLPLRVRQSQESATRLASMLSDHPAVDRVRYPGLGSERDRELVARQMDGPGSMLAFDVAGGRDPAIRVIERLRIVKLAGSLGGMESLAMHPVSMSHVSMSAGELAEAGIGPGLVRIAVGCETTADLEKDLRQALDPLV